MRDTSPDQAPTGIMQATSPLLAGQRLDLDPVSERVRLGARELTLGGRSYRLLKALMEEPQRLIAKNKLIEAVWDGRAVSDAVLTTAIRELRTALQDDARRPVWIKTEHGRGYRFIGRVQSTGAAAPGPSARSEAADLARAQPEVASDGRRSNSWRTVIIGAAAAAAILAMIAVLTIVRDQSAVQAPDRSIAVLGFEHLTPESEASWFAAGLAEELCSALTRIPDLRVASRRATIAAASDGPSVQVIADRLGVAYILDGAVRVAGERVRVTVSLVDARDGAQVWSQNYDAEFSDILQLQADIAAEAAMTLDTALDPGVLREMASAGTDSIAAYEAYLRGQAKIAEFNRTGAPEPWHESLAFFDRARSIDPDFAQAHAISALVVRYLNTPSLVMQRDAVSGEAYRREYAARMDAAIAAARDPIEAAGFRAVRHLELFELAAAGDAFETYLEARPNDIEAGFEYANTLVSLGRHAEARRIVRRLSQTIPRQDAANRGMLIQHATKSRDFDLAGQLARETLADHPFNSFVLVESHWALLRIGEIDLAREVVERLEASEVGWVAQMGVRMNQLCAEGNRIEAEPLASQLIDHPSAFITAWHAFRALGDDEAAYARLVQLDQPGPPPPRLRALLVGDPAFDPSRFPHLSAALLEAGGRLAAPAPAAVRCPPA